MMPKAKAKTKGVPSPHHYFYPGSDVLKNKHGIKDSNAFLKQYSHDIEKGVARLRDEPAPDCFDSSYLCHVHKTLFSATFEWAGQLRNVPFMFEDGTTAAMPEIIRMDWGNVFATGDEIQIGLQRLDQTLFENSNFQGLSRKEFVDQAARLFASLHRTKPFVAGNQRTREIFFEKLAQSAGYQLDFSLSDRNSITLASIKATEEGDLKPLRDLFENISNPEKISVLREHTDYKKTQQEGLVSSKQPETLKHSDTPAFTVQTIENHENILIPGRKLSSLRKSEVSEMIKEDACVCTSREQIEILSRIVYGNSKTLDEKMVRILEDPSCAQELANRIEAAPGSVASLAGISFCGLKNRTRKIAESCSDMLAHAVVNFSHAIRYAENEINKNHQNEQSRSETAVKMPSKNLQDLLALSKEMQTTILKNSSMLQKELNDFVKIVNNRLSSDEKKAIKNGDYKELAEIMAVTGDKAKQITDVVQKAKELQQQFQMRTVNISKSLAIAS
ncbi:BID domain-containing T4SS effector [Bartonella sp. B23]